MKREVHPLRVVLKAVSLPAGAAAAGGTPGAEPEGENDVVEGEIVDEGGER